MDYSKKGIQNKQQYIKSTSRRLVSKTRITLFRFCIVFFVFLVIVGAYAGFGFIKGLADSAPDMSQIDVVPRGFTTKVFDKEGNQIENLVGAQSNRDYVSIDEIPYVIEKAFIAIEDERFYEHDGIDVQGLFRVFFQALTGGDFVGASTITQQLLKNQVFEGGREPEFIGKVERKIQEQYLAIQLENIYEKDKILEYYLNTINLGSGTYGVQTASKRYFNKDVQDITLSEAAVIAAITQLPVYLNPITYPENNAQRRAAILGNMLEQGYCTQEEYDEAMADDVYARIQSVNEELDSKSFYSYFTDELIEQVMEDLQSELGYTQTQASNLLYSGGLSIYTTQDPVIQQIADEIYADEENFPEMGVSFWELTYALSIQKNDDEKTPIHYHSEDLLEFYKDYDDPDKLYVDDGNSKFSLLFLDKEDMQEKINAFKDAMLEDGDTVLGEKITMTIQPQSSFVVMDQYTGHVVAIIGGRGEKTGNRTLNRATNTTRQPGSTFKVLSTYLPALDTAGLTLASVQDDAGPYYYPGTEKEVSNWTEKKEYEGLSTLRRGIYHSMNIVTVKTLEQVTPQVGYDYLLDLGFTTLVDTRKEPDGRVVSDIHYPMALGGLTDGVTNLELTAAYGAIANGGVYIEPILYTKILDHNGKVLLEKTPERNQVMKESTAWLLTNAMEDVVTVGTGKTLKLKEVNMPVAGKTGSTSDYNDLWFSGYSPYYTATVWSGFDHNRPQTDKSYQRHIWRKIMEQIHIRLGLETKTFTMPGSIVTAKVCTKSGKLAVEGLCDQYEGGDSTRIEYFAKGTEPTEKCDIHIKAKICTESNSLATDNCPLSDIRETVLLKKAETAVTYDTPYVLPTKNCNVHTGFYYEDEEPFEPEYEDEFLNNIFFYNRNRSDNEEE
ncbi:transglycosylase domain-containing protein [Mobilitalea sibirica]|uniref:Penicillin-binding protein 1A n=1 Tax=Mobilitalea sibirica TaxID=1462919 RepID=A0A8J7H5R3_9FIRM|nr:transglycosylase domain-containing protein [Mobilitalea sibirica]MBH1940306.1 transglycosylase domain-containing protein [Mobilitalea sibirica]